VQVPGSFTRLTGLPRNTYTAHVIAVNRMGAESPEAYLEFNIQAPPPPSRVDIEQGFFAVTLILDLLSWSMFPLSLISGHQEKHRSRCAKRRWKAVPRARVWVQHGPVMS
jgi:predicted phage tail protein